MSETVLIQKENHIATILINQPETGNALGISSFHALSEAFQRCEEDDEVRAIVLTGKGKHFSSGGNIRDFLSCVESGELLQADEIVVGLRLALQIHRCAKPTIAMINNAAFGAGCSLACACDFRVVDSESKFCMAFINMALSGDTGSIYLLSSLVGFPKAKEMMMLGTVVSGEEAVRIGLATRMAEPGTLVEETYKLANKLANGPLLAYRRQKELMNDYIYLCDRFEQYGQKEAQYLAECMRTEDFSEAVHAFVEKRKPHFNSK